jgi:hypothetical protein
MHENLCTSIPLRNGFFFFSEHTIRAKKQSFILRPVQTDLLGTKMMVAMDLDAKKTADEVVLESHPPFPYTTFSSCAKRPPVQFQLELFSALIASFQFVPSFAAPSPPALKRQIRRHHLLLRVSRKYFQQKCILSYAKNSTIDRLLAKRQSFDASRTHTS